MLKTESKSACEQLHIALTMTAPTFNIQVEAKPQKKKHPHVLSPADMQCHITTKLCM